MNNCCSVSITRDIQILITYLNKLIRQYSAQNMTLILDVIFSLITINTCKCVTLLNEKLKETLKHKSTHVQQFDTHSNKIR